MVQKHHGVVKDASGGGAHYGGRMFVKDPVNTMTLEDAIGTDGFNG